MTEMTSLAKIRRLRKAIREIDKMAEAGMCQYTSDGKHVFLKDIRRIALELNLQGGLTGVYDLKI